MIDPLKTQGAAAVAPGRKMMKTTFNKGLLLAGMALVLTACGGGGGSSSTPIVTQPDTVIFQVSVEDIAVTRLSNDEAVPVDTAALNSGELTFTP